jgi:hypothetical protein
MWCAMGEYADLSVHDVLDEVMDMAAPAAPGRVTLQVRRGAARHGAGPAAGLAVRADGTA